MPVTRLASSMVMNGRAACLRFGKTALRDPPQAVLLVAVAVLEVALELAVVSAGAVALLVAEDTVAGSPDVEATVVDMVLLLLPDTTLGLPLRLPILSLTTLLLVASAARLSTSVTYVFTLFLLHRNVADGHSCHGLRAMRT